MREAGRGVQCEAVCRFNMPRRFRDEQHHIIDSTRMTTWRYLGRWFRRCQEEIRLVMRAARRRALSAEVAAVIDDNMRVSRALPLDRW